MKLLVYQKYKSNQRILLIYLMKLTKYITFSYFKCVNRQAALVSNHQNYFCQSACISIYCEIRIVFLQTILFSIYINRTCSSFTELFQFQFQILYLQIASAISTIHYTNTAIDHVKNRLIQKKVKVNLKTDAIQITALCGH